MVRSDERRAYYTRRQRYIETIMRDTSNAGMQSCTRSCYSIEYSIRVQWPKSVNTQYKIMKQLKLTLEFKAYYFGSALTVVCSIAVFSVVTQRSSPLMGGALRDDTKNGCVADYSNRSWEKSWLSSWPFVLLSSLWAGLCLEKLVKLNITKTNCFLGKF